MSSEHELGMDNYIMTVYEDVQAPVDQSLQP